MVTVGLQQKGRWKSKDQKCTVVAVLSGLESKAGLGFTTSEELQLLLSETLVSASEKAVAVVPVNVTPR